MTRFQAVIEEIYGLPCWNVHWDANLNLSMNFGQPSLKIREPRDVFTTNEKVRQLFTLRQVTLRGEWFLWILNSYWKLTIPEFGQVTGASSYKRMQMTFKRLEGQKITHLSINPKTSATHMEFDLGANLDARRLAPKEDGDIWSLYCPNQHVLSVRGDGKYSYEIGSKPPNQDHWIPFADFKMDKN